ncbi:MAG: hypothetical protein JNK74_03390 [Candidatus Hydrogenedentes bacterium]|nr:hypothetical protein [Candidatus Hydrogenedentota bacterium]
MFDAINNAVAALFGAVGAAFTNLCKTVFYPVLIKFFGPINTFLSGIYQPWANIFAIGFFVGTMIWVGFILKESYVNVGRPVKAWYTDLRIWTACSMLPHIFVYFYFY